MGNGGTLDWVGLCIFPYSETWSNGKTNNISNAGNYVSRTSVSTVLSGSYSYVLKSLNSSFSHGSRYRTAIRFSDNNYEFLSGSDKVIYTYQEPTINTTVTTKYSAPQNAIMENTFTISGTNSRAWSSYENTFQTMYRIKKGSDNYTDWSNLGDITTWSRTATEMRNLVSKSYDGQTCTLQFKRYSPSSSWYSSNTASTTVMLYYTPRSGVTSSNVSYYQNSSSGSSISQGQVLTNTDSLSSIYVKWTYDTYAVNAGFTQGYRVRLYDSSGTVIATYYTTNKYITIPKSDIPRLGSSTIDITPYYANDSSDPSNYWYYSSPTQINFVSIVAELNTPSIDYPIASSKWINDDFRICFTLPTDPDYGYQSGTYYYENIEVSINDYIIRLADSNGTSSGSVLQPTCFSCLSSNLTYQRPVVVYPNLVSRNDKC